MVRSLVQQQDSQSLQAPPVPHDSDIPAQSAVQSHEELLDESPRSALVNSRVFNPQASSTNEDLRTVAMSLSPTILLSDSHKVESIAPSPSPSEQGTMRVSSYGSKYVNSVHWAAVLDSISELKDHYDKEEEARVLADINDSTPIYSPGPRLLYEPVQATKEDIITSIPARPVVDRLVARYFNAHGVAPGMFFVSGRLKPQQQIQ